MDRETQAPFGSSPPTVPQACPVRTSMCAALIGVATLAALAVIALQPGVFEMVSRNGMAQDREGVLQSAPGDLLAKLDLFRGWNRPAVVLVLSGEQHGYLQPCGCSEPQFGGLTRRYNLLQALRQRGWPIVAADLGDINQKSGPQAILKYRYAMQALDMMDYTAVGFGEYEMSMPLMDCLAHYSLNAKTPRVVSANLLGRKPGEPFYDVVFDMALADKQAGPKVGIIGLTGPSVRNTVKDPHVKFDGNTPKILLENLHELKNSKAELVVLLYQGDLKDAAICAEFCKEAAAKDRTLPRLDVILCLSAASEPPGQPSQIVGDTMIVEVGYKGRYVGVVGVFARKGPTPYELKYQLVAMGPEFKTPEGQEKDHKLMQAMEDYAKEVRDGNYLAKYKQTSHPVQLTYPKAEYVGSDKCMNCHPHAFNVWKESKHSKAYEALVVKAKDPGLRQFDGECVVCHTVGFGYRTGFESLEKSKFLTDVGCESCHGPSSEHVAKPRNAALYPAINPHKWRGPGQPDNAQKNTRLLNIDISCQKCHDLDNDNNFQFKVNWPKISHMTPR